jgi:hypothetical protein
MVEEHQQTNEEIIYDLLMEFKDHRNAVMSMVSDIEKLKEKIDRIIPEKLDARYVRFFEEKVKTATEFFKTLLEMRKEIQKSLKDEIEIRRKINVQEGEMGVEDIINIRDLVDRVEGFKRDKDKIREKTVKLAQDATDKIGEEVQKMNAM